MLSAALCALLLPDLLQELVREVVAFADMGAASEAGPSAPGSAEQPRQPLSPLQQPADGDIAPSARWVCLSHPAVMSFISSQMGSSGCFEAAILLACAAAEFAVSCTCQQRG